MTVISESKSSKKKPFKLTKELVRLALNDGWTQTEIAGKCRVQQSIVSSWNRGSRKGTEQQLRPLLDSYGHKLRRNTFKVYWSIDAETREKFFYRVEGKVVFSHIFNKALSNTYRKHVKKIPMQKLVVHYQGSDQFLLVSQHRIPTTLYNEKYIESNVEEAIWTSNVYGSIDLKELIKTIDECAEEFLECFPNDACSLPFIIRQALLNHGFSIDNVVEFPAVW